MDETTLLVPDEKVVVVHGKQYRLKKLSILQSIKLTKLVAKTVLGSREVLQKFTKETAKSTSNVTDILGLLDLLSEEDVTRFFQILLKDDSVNDIGLDEATEILACIFENNTFFKVKENFQRIVAALNSQTKKVD